MLLTLNLVKVISKMPSYGLRGIDGMKRTEKSPKPTMYYFYMIKISGIITKFKKT